MRLLALLSKPRVQNPRRGQSIVPWNASTPCLGRSTAGRLGPSSTRTGPGTAPPDPFSFEGSGGSSERRDLALMKGAGNHQLLANPKGFGDGKTIRLRHFFRREPVRVGNSIERLSRLNGVVPLERRPALDGPAEDGWRSSPEPDSCAGKRS